MIPASTILAYDRSLNREGISIDQSDGFFQVITPRLGSWRALSKWWMFGIILLSFYSIGPFAGAMMRQKPMEFEEIFMTVEFTSLLAMVITCAFIKLNQRFVFEITRDRFTVTRIMFASIRRRWMIRAPRSRTFTRVPSRAS